MIKGSAPRPDGHTVMPKSLSHTQTHTHSCEAYLPEHYKLPVLQEHCSFVVHVQDVSSVYTTTTGKFRPPNQAGPSDFRHPTPGSRQ